MPPLLNRAAPPWTGIRSIIRSSVSFPHFSIFIVYFTHIKLSLIVDIVASEQPIKTHFMCLSQCLLVAFTPLDQRLMWEIDNVFDNFDSSKKVCTAV